MLCSSFFREHANNFSSLSPYSRKRIFKHISIYFQQQVSSTQDSIQNNIKVLKSNTIHSDVRYNASHYSVEQSNPCYSSSLLLVTDYSLSLRVVLSIIVFGRKFSLNSLWSCLGLLYTAGLNQILLCVSFSRFDFSKWQLAWIYESELQQTVVWTALALRDSDLYPCFSPNLYKFWILIVVPPLTVTIVAILHTCVLL